MDHQPGEETPRCPVCGASLQSGLAACAACGTPLADMFSSAPTAPASPMADAPIASAQLAPDPATAQPSGATADMAAEPGVTPHDSWRCGWCGQMNATGTDQCAHCGAMFPRPEADAALQRQAEARMRAELDALGTLQRRRSRKGLGRLFSN